MECLLNCVNFVNGNIFNIFFAYFSVPAFQFLGAMPLTVIKGSMSRLVEPQEQGKFIRKIYR